MTKNELFENALNIAWTFRQKAKAYHLTPKRYMMGMSLYYGLEGYIKNDLSYAYVVNDIEGKATLFGIPIDIYKDDAWKLTLEVEEYSIDLEEIKNA